MSSMVSDNASPTVVHPFSFDGNGVEYFLICLRTFLLAIITLGIYDAWGTVERRRYFWGNTKVAGHGFDYHARPVQILVGRLIIIGILIAIQLIGAFFPLFSLIFPIAFIVLLPWIYNRVLEFQLGNTSYRNIRFRFAGSYWHAFLLIIVMPVFVLPLSLGLLYPLYAKLLREYTINQTFFGRSSFFVSIPVGPLFKVFALAVVVFMLPFFAIVGYGIYEFVTLAMEVGKSGGGASGEIQQRVASMGPYFAGFYVAAIIGFLIFATVFNTVLRNVAVSATVVEGGHTFGSDVPVMGYLWRVLSRGFLATVSIGLLLPWARVDLHRYLMGHTTLHAKGDLDRFIGEGENAGGAAAAEYGIMDGIADGAIGI
ncbi:MAG: YjgN family protein [Alphaproteobacteria bacterium]